ncbi:polysialyltransferase family glycosyltransferase [Hydrogenophaga sp. PAMC20947]|uniref:polysialyltransferase family glycosyltransferase n=1 Tax=Hydrogenophaga sp. PAMC20947 TaxID=2565558 RepID=UPI001444B0B0|nr:polysialyltransferase family glycosyltransferase [Hydrogenophaga sp. PAMC20947]
MATYLYLAFTRPQLSFVLRHFYQNRIGNSAYLIFTGTSQDLDITEENGFSKIAAIPSSTGRLNRKNVHALRAVQTHLKSWDVSITDIVYPGLLHPLMNAIYAIFSKNENCRHYIYAEGISSYLELTLPIKWKIKFSIFRCISWMYGFSFGLTISGHPHGLDMPNVAGLIAEYPDLLSRHGKQIELLPTHTSSIEFSGENLNAVMFVGQPHLDPRFDLNDLYTNLAHGLNEYFNLPLIYKPHHFESLEQLAAAKSAGFKLLETNIPFEILAKTTRPAALVSFRSTVLLNAPRLLGDGVPIYTFAPFLVSPPDENGSLVELRNVLKQFGVKSFPTGSFLANFETIMSNSIGQRL